MNPKNEGLGTQKSANNPKEWGEYIEFEEVAGGKWSPGTGNFLPLGDQMAKITSLAKTVGAGTGKALGNILFHAGTAAGFVVVVVVVGAVQCLSLIATSLVHVAKDIYIQQKDIARHRKEMQGRHQDDIRTTRQGDNGKTVIINNYYNL